MAGVQIAGGTEYLFVERPTYMHSISYIVLLSTAAVTKCPDQRNLPLR